MILLLQDKRVKCYPRKLRLGFLSIKYSLHFEFLLHSTFASSTATLLNIIVDGWVKKWMMKFSIRIETLEVNISITILWDNLCRDWSSGVRCFDSQVTYCGDETKRIKETSSKAPVQGCVMRKVVEGVWCSWLGVGIHWARQDLCRQLPTQHPLKTQQFLQNKQFSSIIH